MISIKIKNPLLTHYLRDVSIFDFNSGILSIKNTNNDNLERISNFKYDEYHFYFIIDNLKSYFKYSKEKDTTEKKLNFIIEDHIKRKTYNQIWDKIKGLINNIEDVNFRFTDYSRDRNVITFDNDDTLPLDAMVSVYSITIIIGSVYKTCCNRFYPQIYLANCIDKNC